MTERVQSYPLHWPQGFPRTPAASRERGQFRTKYDAALDNVIKSLRLFGTDSARKIVDPVLSSNRDMLGQIKDQDPGTAVWFVWDGMQVCIPVDRYLDPAHNLQAIHHIVEARRVELRHGSLALIRATFTGFKALPAPAGKHWRDILGIGSRAASREAIEAAFKRLAQERHPDKPGGSTEAMQELSEAKRTALAEVGA
jgi:hypothetical protein